MEVVDRFEVLIFLISAHGWLVAPTVPVDTGVKVSVDSEGCIGCECTRAEDMWCCDWRDVDVDFELGFVLDLNSPILGSISVKIGVERR